MTLDQAERLLANDDYKAFLEVLDDDAKSILEDLVSHRDIVEITRTQCKIEVLRGVKARLNHLIDDLKAEVPVSGQTAVLSE